MPSKTERLRQLINDPAILVLPGIYDGYSARMVTQAGFPAGFVTGAGISEASLGWSDLGVMGCEENLRVCRAIVGCCDLPLLADGDTGYGNAVNVHFTVRGFEQAGLAGLFG
jgi:2-methylisocitrate lyase-like PEP mutase family enzyme